MTSAAIVRLLRYTLLILLALGSLGVAAAEVGIISYAHFLYLAAENLIAVGTLIAFALVLTSNREFAGSPPVRLVREHPLIVAAGAGLISALASLALLIAADVDFFVYAAAIAALMGLGVGIVGYIALTDLHEAGQGRPRSIRWYALFAVLLVIAGALRVTAPGTPLLTYIFAPLLYFLLPGFALTFALLPDDARWLDHLVYAPPLSIGAQFVGVAWLVQVGIPIAPQVFYITASVILLLGYAIALLRHRRDERRGLSPSSASDEQ